MIILTPQGKEHVQTYIEELKAKRKEILDAKKDTAYNTNLPNENDILSDMSWVIEESDDGNYLNNWEVTDNYRQRDIKKEGLTFGNYAEFLCCREGRYHRRF